MMTCNRAFAPLVLFGPGLLMTGCASAGDEYPSLAIRDAERVAGTLPSPAAYVPPPITPQVADRLTQLSSDVASAHRAFLAEAPRARSAVQAARGAGPGSEAWSVAQVALAGLESARSRAMIALADLDRLYVDAATQGTEFTRVAAARETAIGLVGQQDTTIDGLLRTLGS